MSNLLTTTIRTRHTRSSVAFGVGVLLGALLVWSALSGMTSESTVVDVDAWPSSNEVAEPTFLRIPAVDLAVSFGTPLGVTDEGAAEVPSSFAEVGWFSYGPKPGALGPAVVFGHIDSVDGPAAFYNLRNVVAGDVIEIDRADGSTAVFVVMKKQYRSQATFPTEEVYADLPYPGLRLITCSGTFEGDTGRYTHNLIVYARLLESSVPNS